MRNQQVRRDRMYPAGKRMAAQRRRRRKRNLRLGFVLLLFLLLILGVLRFTGRCSNAYTERTGEGIDALRPPHGCGASDGESLFQTRDRHGKDPGDRGALYSQSRGDSHG